MAVVQDGVEVVVEVVREGDVVDVGVDIVSTDVEDLEYWSGW
jgi:hypothetical protein